MRFLSMIKLFTNIYIHIYPAPHFRRYFYLPGSVLAYLHGLFNVLSSENILCYTHPCRPRSVVVIFVVNGWISIWQWYLTETQVVKDKSLIWHSCIQRNMAWWWLMTVNTPRPYIRKANPWAPCQIHKIAGCACAGNAGNIFPVISG